MAAPQDNLSDAIRYHFVGEKIHRFISDGYVVLSNSLTHAACKKFLDEIQSSFFTQDGHESAFMPNMVEFLTQQGPVRLTKPGIFENDLHKKKSRENMPMFESLFSGGDDEPNGEKGEAEKIVDIVNERFPEMALLSPSTTFQSSKKKTMADFITVKMQVNSGGGFPMHQDNPGRGGGGSARKLTLILYLTEKWQKQRDDKNHINDKDDSDHEDTCRGGEVVIYPFLGQPVKIAPVFNTLLLFRSDLSLHRVLPPAPSLSSASSSSSIFSPSLQNRHRYCFTIWFDSQNVNADDDVFLKQKHLAPENFDATVEALKRTPLQRSVVRCVYDEEFRESLRDTFLALGSGVDDVKATVISLKIHEAHCAQLLKQPAVAQFIDRLRQLKK